MQKTLEFWYDFSSPFSYLASTQVEQVAARHGATLSWKPMLLGAVFKEVGTANVPMLAAGPAKQQYMARELKYWSSYWDVPFKFNSTFPLKTVTALRLALLAEDRIGELSHALYRAAWVDDRDISQPEILAQILTPMGFDARAMLEKTQDPAVKQRLIDHTSSAVEAGIFGAPSFIVKGGGPDLLFWGQDRLMLVEKALDGWRPAMG